MQGIQRGAQGRDVAELHSALKRLTGQLWADAIPVAEERDDPDVVAGRLQQRDGVVLHPGAAAKVAQHDHPGGVSATAHHTHYSSERLSSGSERIDTFKLKGRSPPNKRRALGLSLTGRLERRVMQKLIDVPSGASRNHERSKRVCCNSLYVLTRRPL